METKFMRWGNSLGLRIPSAFVKQLGAEEGKSVEMAIEGNALVIRIAKRRRDRRYRLEDLVAAITDENAQPEIDWGRPRGNEIW